MVDDLSAYGNTETSRRKAEAATSSDKGMYSQSESPRKRLPEEDYKQYRNTDESPKMYRPN
jgi:hypothetical protein